MQVRCVRRRMSELRHGERRVPHSRGHVGWHACSARIRSQACMQRGARADAFAEACEPILRLKFKLPVSAPRNGFIIGVFLLMCPFCLQRQSSPPCAQFDHRHLLVRVLRHRCPRAARPVFLVWSFRLLPCPQSFKFCPLLEKMEECTVSKKEASSCHTSNTKLKEFDMTRMTNF